MQRGRDTGSNSKADSNPKRRRDMLGRSGNSLSHQFEGATLNGIFSVYFA
jgi:hypothetical protein